MTRRDTAPVSAHRERKLVTLDGQIGPEEVVGRRPRRFARELLSRREVLGAAAVAGASLAWAFDNNLSQRLSLRDPVAVTGVKALVADPVLPHHRHPHHRH